MRFVRLGRSGLQVSELAFGTMSFGGDANKDVSREMYTRCREAGVTFFDCANVYNDGWAERFLGEFAAHERDDVVISSKVYFPTGPGPNDRGLSRLHIIAAVEQSLERLNTDRLDILFLHRWDPHTPLQESLRACDALIAAGKVRYLGVSNFSAWQTMKALGVADVLGADRVVCMQPMYNLLKRQAEVELLPLAAHEGLGVVPYSPLAGGFLTGKYGTQRQPSEGRLQTNEMYKIRYGDPGYLSAADELVAMAAEMGVHPAALAIAWVAHNPAVTAPILGARNVPQLQTALSAAEIDIAPDMLRRLATLVPEPPPPTDRNEERSAANYAAQLRGGPKPARATDEV